MCRVRREVLVAGSRGSHGPLGTGYTTAMAHAEKHVNALLMLSPEERIEAANKLLDSVEDDEDAGWEDAWIAEMTARMRGIQDSTRQTVDADTARARVLQRLRTLRR